MINVNILQYIAILRLCLILCYRDCHCKLSLHKCGSKKRELLSCLNICAIQSMLSVQPTCFEKRHPGPGSFCINVSQLPTPKSCILPNLSTQDSPFTGFFCDTVFDDNHILKLKSFNDGGKMRLALKSKAQSNLNLEVGEFRQYKRLKDTETKIWSYP